MAQHGVLRVKEWRQSRVLSGLTCEIAEPSVREKSALELLERAKIWAMCAYVCSLMIVWKWLTSASERKQGRERRAVAITRFSPRCTRRSWQDDRPKPCHTAWAESVRTRACTVFQVHTGCVGTRRNHRIKRLYNSPSTSGRNALVIEGSAMIRVRATAAAALALSSASLGCLRCSSAVEAATGPDAFCGGRFRQLLPWGSAILRSSDESRCALYLKTSADQRRIAAPRFGLL
jgi:hypothetical protein